MSAALAIIASYLLGSVCFAYVAGRVGGGIDLRRHGSGNLGATNVLRVLGPFAAVAVVLGDTAKGYVAVRLGMALAPGNLLVSFACGIAAILGHNWPVYLGFRGGKGIATSLGVLLGLMPVTVIPPAVVFLLSVVLTRFVSLGSILAAITFPVSVVLLRHTLPPGNPALYVAGSIVVAVFALYRHLPNLKRLMTGKEHKIGERVGATEPEKVSVSGDGGPQR